MIKNPSPKRPTNYPIRFPARKTMRTNKLVPGRAGVVMITTKPNRVTLVQYEAGVEKLKESELLP